MPEDQNKKDLKPKAPNPERNLTDNDSAATDNGCPHCSDYLNGWKRAQADYANLKKEMDRAYIDLSAAANERAVMGLLPALDQFETALEHAPDLSNLPEEDRKKLQNWFDGMRAVKNTWEQTLKNFGLESVETAGAFDPIKHEAVGKEEDATKQQDHIVRTVRRGWMMNGKVIRPAAVTVNALDKTSSN